jgi:hypothetical protein
VTVTGVDDVAALESDTTEDPVDCTDDGLAGSQVEDDVGGEVDRPELGRDRLGVRAEKDRHGLAGISVVGLHLEISP